MRYVCRRGCVTEITMSEVSKRAGEKCEEHGERFVYAKALTRKAERRTPSDIPLTKRPKGMKRSRLERDWKDARAKVDEEEVCRVCGSNEQVEAAHVIGRQADQRKPGFASGPLWVNPDSIIPLCGPYSQMKCHVAHDSHSIDILEHLTLDEQVQAVRDAGGIESARRRVAPSLYRIIPDRTVAA